MRHVAAARQQLQQLHENVALEGQVEELRGFLLDRVPQAAGLWMGNGRQEKEDCGIDFAF